VNHSHKPNCRMEEKIVDCLPRLLLYAIRAITHGEELTFNYDGQPGFEGQPCFCASCREAEQ
jgi:SET domain-containing protein